MNSLGTEDGVNMVTTVCRTSMYCSKSGISAHTWMNIKMLIYHQHDTLMRDRERGGGERGSDRGKGERGEIEAVKTGRHIERQGNTEREEKGRENKQKMKHVSV